MMKLEEVMLGEERQWARIPINFHALYAGPDGSFHEELVTNLSKGGLFLRTAKPCPKGEKLEIILMLPDSNHEVTVQGQVMHSVTAGLEEERGMGIMFTTIEPNLKKILGEYLCTLEEKNEVGKRVSPRVDTPPSRIHLTANQGEQSATLCNLSRHGMFIRTRATLSLFERVQMLLTNPETGLQLELNGEVVHLRKAETNPIIYGAGIRFVDLDLETEKTVLDLMSEIMFHQQLNLSQISRSSCV